MTEITSLEFVENIFGLMNWNRECRYKVLGRVANSDQGLCMLFDLEEAIMFTPKPQEYTDPITGELRTSKIFKETYGTTVNIYLISKRITRAKQLLRFTDMTVDEVGAAVGMGDSGRHEAYQGQGRDNHHL